MKKHFSLGERLHLVGLVFALTFWLLITISAHACTIFVLTDGARVLFCNNEDWSNPATRIWFIPAGEGYRGCVYVGFDDGWPQGGLNTEGLAFDWVAGFNEKWDPATGLRSVRGNPSARMLETCATVEDAVAFYRTHFEPSFSTCKILVADRTGASAIIGAKDGQLQIERASQNRGFGYGRQTLARMLTQHLEPTVTNGVTILRACSQDGQYATKYSNVFDLKSGDIFLFTSPALKNSEVKLDLAAEFKKGEHYYDIPQIREQFTQAPRPLLDVMKRLFVDTFKAIPDPEPKTTEHLRTMVEDAAAGTMQPNDYTPEFGKELLAAQKEIQAELGRLGNLILMTLVGRMEENGRRSYLYRMEFENFTVLQRFILNEQNKVAFIKSEFAERKFGGGVGVN